jgi:hypothetical protein
MLMMHALTAKQRETDSNAKSSSVEERRKEIKEATEKLQAALEEARKARENSSFWDDLFGVFTKIAQVVAAVAAVAGAVVTGGGSLAGALAIGSATMSGLATANKELGIIKGPLGDALNTALSVGSAAMGVGAAGVGLFASAGTAASAAAETARVGNYLKTGATLTTGIAQSGAAVAKGVSAVYVREQQLHEADAEEAASASRAAQRRQESEVRDFRRLHAEYQRSLDALVSAMGEQQRTRDALAGAIRG